MGRRGTRVIRPRSSSFIVTLVRVVAYCCTGFFLFVNRGNVQDLYFEVCGSAYMHTRGCFILPSIRRCIPHLGAVWTKIDANGNTIFFKRKSYSKDIHGNILYRSL